MESKRKDYPPKRDRADLVIAIIALVVIAVLVYMLLNTSPG